MHGLLLCGKAGVVYGSNKPVMESIDKTVVLTGSAVSQQHILTEI